MSIQWVVRSDGTQGPLFHDYDDDDFFLAWACCCFSWICGSDLLTFYGETINITFDGLGGCLTPYNGDNELDLVGQLDYAPSGWFQDFYGEDGNACGWLLLEEDEDGTEYNISFGLYTDGAGNYRWVIYAAIRIVSGSPVGRASKVWYRTHTTGNYDLYGAYTEWSCTSTLGCLTANTCGLSAGATATV
jgi:hypothetical protein